MLVRFSLLMLFGCANFTFGSPPPRELRVGLAGHAFDHLGNIGDQAMTAVASGANIIYVTGCGASGYSGLPAGATWAQEQRSVAEYVRDAKRQGIKLALGYLCATSIVKLGSFDQNWSPEFRAQFKSPPSTWLQQDRDGNPLASWYGGDYRPACMNHPDWRAYERALVRATLAAGGDGVFFDNPTVHPQGCFCIFCMERFSSFLAVEANAPLPKASVEALRKLAIARPDDFRRFRATIARDFLAEMVAEARTVKRGALITANNSLNSANVLYSQIRSYGYSIYEMSKAEDFVVVEDMASQPRTLADGRTVEYGPTYRQLHAISHGKPVVAVTIADGDYHTAPNLVRLAMAEAAAHGASHLWWPTWPENERGRLSAAIRLEADFLRQHEELLNETRVRTDAALFLPMRRWVETDKCRASELAAALTRANVQYTVLTEDDLAATHKKFATVVPAGKVFIAESLGVFNERESRRLGTWRKAGGELITAEKPDWVEQVRVAIRRPSVTLVAPVTVRAVVCDQTKRTMVHLLNLDVRRLSSFDDKVNPVSNVRVTLRVPFKPMHSVKALTADAGGSRGPLPFTARPEGRETVVETTLGQLEIATLLVCE